MLRRAQRTGFFLVLMDSQEGILEINFLMSSINTRQEALYLVIMAVQNIRFDLVFIYGDVEVTVPGSSIDTLAVSEFGLGIAYYFVDTVSSQGEGYRFHGSGGLTSIDAENTVKNTAPGESGEVTYVGLGVSSLTACADLNGVALRCCGIAVFAKGNALRRECSNIIVVIVAATASTTTSNEKDACY